MSKGKIRVSMSIDEERQPKVSFSPQPNDKNFKEHFNNLVNGTANAFIDLLAMTGMLRPATTKEIESHVYVFETDDENDLEHKVYKSRSDLYNTITSVFSGILHVAFPDVEYIQQCKEFQQEQTFNEDYNHDSYMADVKATTEWVRKHYKELLTKPEEEIPTDDESSRA